MLFLARRARKLSWKETAQSFCTSWDQVCHAVEYVVEWGLQHRTLAPISAIGVDEMQFAKGHKYLTLVYQIDAGATRLLRVGKERTVEAFQGFFTMLGEELTSKIQFVCSDTYFISGAHYRSPCCSLGWAPVGSILFAAEEHSRLDELHVEDGGKGFYRPRRSRAGRQMEV
jgi:Transposase